MMDTNTAVGPDSQPQEVDFVGPQKPRIAIMGEFSAGKSTLSNLLIGTPSLPVKVTATQLPPVWISYGDQASCRIDLDGNESPFDLDDLADISVEDTLYLRVFHKSDVLEQCDLIDMPGISDPNMPSAVWERVLHHADGVIWCTHATQAWRQSEAAVWSMVDPLLHAKSLLLLTRIDKIINERDRLRVVRRVENETKGLFTGVFPVSLTGATEAGEDLDLWQKSGADAFGIALVELVDSIAQTSGDAHPAGPVPAEPMAKCADSVSVLSRPAPPPPAQDDAPGVVPQRVARVSHAGQRSERPVREDAVPRPF